MLPRAISALLCIWALFLAGPASAWEQNAVRTAEQLMNGHCVDRNAPNTVYLLNSNSGEFMSEIEERKAMSALAMAFLDHGRFQLTRGETLQYEAYMTENTDTGRRELQNTMERLSASTVTMFFVPVGRDHDIAYADVVFLARITENGQTRLRCGTSITVDIPTTTRVVPPPPPGLDVVEFIREFHRVANTRPCTDIGVFYASEFVVATEARTLVRSLPEQIRMQCDIRKRHPVYLLHEDTVHVTDLGGGRYRVNYSNTSEIDGENGGRVTTDWFLESIVEEQNGQLKFTRVALASSQR